MDVSIGFYSDKKVYINFTHGFGNDYPRNRANDLFLLSCLALRQFQILDTHLAAKSLVGVISSDQIREIAKDSTPTLPNSKESLILVGKFVDQIYKDLNAKGSVEVSDLESWVKKVIDGLSYDDGIHDAMDDMILMKVPEIVKYRRKAKRRFDISIPPFRMKLLGFGKLGRFANHHMFYSVLMFFRYLYQQDPTPDFLEEMLKILRYCARSYITDSIPFDTIGLANLIKEKIGY